MGKQRQRTGWVEMWHPTLPNNDPIAVHESAVAGKIEKGWLAAGEEDMPTVEDSDDSEWDEDED